MLMIDGFYVNDKVQHGLAYAVLVVCFDRHDMVADFGGIVVGAVTGLCLRPWVSPAVN